MDTIETLIPDNEGNHLVVVLCFYDDNDKLDTFCIPHDFIDVEIADISINKLDMDVPLYPVAFYRMCDWLLSQFLLFPDAVFSFICSTDPLEMRHSDMASERYRWNLFDCLFARVSPKLQKLGIKSKDVLVGPDGCQTYAKIFFRDRHAPVIHLVAAHLCSKYDG